MYEAQGNKQQDLARIVSERHCQRLEALIKSVDTSKGEKARGFVYMVMCVLDCMCVFVCVRVYVKDRAHTHTRPHPQNSPPPQKNTPPNSPPPPHQRNPPQTHRPTNIIKSSTKQNNTQIEVGGDVDVKARWVAPTIVSGVTPDSALMQEEIFGA